MARVHGRSGTAWAQRARGPDRSIADAPMSSVTLPRFAIPDGATLLGLALLVAGCALASCALSSCASSGVERNLAPLYSEYSTAGGGAEREAFCGALRVRYSRPGGA